MDLERFNAALSQAGEADNEKNVRELRLIGCIQEQRQNPGSDLLVSLAMTSVLVEGRGQFTLAQTRQTQGETKTQQETKLIARGKYIVEGLAACGDCHTPRNSNGEIDRTKWLAGAPVFYEPAQRVPGWAISAPRIAGLPPGSDEEVMTLFTTAVWRRGQVPRPPMPRFHMRREDAEAVVAYLKSL